MRRIPQLNKKKILSLVRAQLAGMARFPELAALFTFPPVVFAAKIAEYLARDNEHELKKKEMVQMTRDVQELLLGLREAYVTNLHDAQKHLGRYSEKLTALGGRPLLGFRAPRPAEEGATSASAPVPGKEGESHAA